MKKISYILCIAMLITSCNFGVLAEENGDFAVYEDFDYSVGEMLNACADAAGPDETKGFAGGWKGDVALTNNPSNNFTIADDRKVSVNVTSGSAAIYRQMLNSVDLSKDFLYCLSATIKINSEVTLDNTHTVKIFLTRQGVSAGTQQLQFGFQGGYGTDKHYSPYMRVKDTTANTQKTVIEPEKTYKLVIKINSHSSSDDVITYSVYDENGNKTGEIQNTKALSDTYDVIAYQEYLGGSLPNEFGNLRVEGYCEQSIVVIDEVRALIDAAKAETTQDSIDSARNALSSLSDGIIKDECNAEIEKLEEIIEKENRLIAEIEAKMSELSSMEITIDNYEQADGALAAVRNDISQLSDEGKAKYAPLADQLEKIIIAKKISVLKVSEKFDYPDGTKANSTAEDVANGWEGGYFADAELTQTPDDSVVFSNGYSPNGMIYRKMYYPVSADDDNVSYVRWQFMLNEGGKAQLQIGNVLFGADVSAFAGENHSETKLESGIKYTAVLRLAKDGARLAIYNQTPICAFDIKTNAVTDGDTVIGIGGNKCTFYSVEMENIPLSYISDAEKAVEKAEKLISEANVNDLLEKVSVLEKCIFKDFAMGCAEGFLNANKNTVPIIRSAGVDGVAYASSVVEAKYVIDDIAENFGSVQITWHCNGNTAVGESYKIPSDAGGADVYFVITVSNKWGLTSQPYTSRSVSVIYQSGGSSSKGGSSGGISGGVSAIKTPDPIPFEKADETSLPFDDVKGHWAQSIIEDLYAKGVINGVSENEFKPDDFVTRAEFTALVTKALAITNGDGNIEFSDVSGNDWFALVVKAAASVGIVNGSDGLFRPNDAITREEAAKICCASLDYLGYVSQNPQTKVFSDTANISEWAVEYVNKTCAAGIMNGNSDGSFNPLGNTTRAESAALASRLSALKK